jgi:dolichol-phosphate mannosyltransferase
LKTFSPSTARVSITRVGATKPMPPVDSRTRSAGVATPVGSVSIIVPTRNEAENILPLVAQIVADGAPFSEILFVDADSTDGTRDAFHSLAAKVPARLISQDPATPGLAAAIIAGAKVATGNLLMVMDADLSHPPERLKDLLAPLLAATADLVIGSRYVNGGSTPGWPWWRRGLSKAASAIAYPLTGVRDSMSGFFAIRRDLLLELAAPAVGFKIVFEAIVHGEPTLRVREIPIAFRDRQHGRSKMSFGVALKFIGRWCIAVIRRVLQGAVRKGATEA